MKLGIHQYGKARVRVARIKRSDDQRHNIHEVDVQVMLRGDFESSYTASDNSLVVPTDTMKNIVNVLAQTELGNEIERFGVALGHHFLAKYSQVSECHVTLAEKVWTRMIFDGQPHPHSFVGSNSAHPWAQVASTRAGTTVSGGIRDLLVLKSTASSFRDFPRCEFTTLPETDDRILATMISATWDYSAQPASYLGSREAILGAMMQVFADDFSPSVQVTLYQMGEAALTAAPEVSRVHLALPNKHYLPVNFAPFGRANPNEIFTPTEEPHGQIEATVERE
jgi:urate oxidase